MRFALALLIALLGSAAEADDFGLAIKDFPDHMTSAFRKLKDRTRVVLVKCLDSTGSNDRTVCTYKLDDYMVAIAAGAPGETALSDLTMICTPTQPIDPAKCVVAYGAAFTAVVPDIPNEDQIVGFLFKGLQVGGDAAQLTKDGHRYILQRVGGAIWFHMEANEEN